MAGHSLERQERNFIFQIKQAIKENKGNPISLVTDAATINGVIKAEKMRKVHRCGSEPYTDVILTVMTQRGKEKVNLSLKGETSPSLAGGGLCGINTVSPGLARKFLRLVHARLMHMIQPGDKVPDTFGKISRHDKTKIVVGSEPMGGPIDYIYMGPMTVTGQYSMMKNQLRINGNLFDAKTYALSHNLYLRLRARSIEQVFDPLAKDVFGVPKIYSGFPGRKDSPGRLAVTDWVTRNALVVQL